jgi:hypothetical protein
MGASLTHGSATRAEALAALAAEGSGPPRSWGNGPGDVYGAHEHERHKILFCVAGSIVFQTPAGEIAMAAGDRLDLPPGTRHAATVGPGGCECVEAWRT